MKLPRQCDGPYDHPRPFNSNSFNMRPFDVRHPSRDARAVRELRCALVRRTNFRLLYTQSSFKVSGVVIEIQ